MNLESVEARLQRHKASVPVTLTLCQSVSLSVCHVRWSFCLLLAPQRRRIMTSPAGSPFASPLSTSLCAAALPSGSFPHPLFLLSLFFVVFFFLYIPFFFFYICAQGPDIALKSKPQWTAGIADLCWTTDGNSHSLLSGYQPACDFYSVAYIIIINFYSVITFSQLIYSLSNLLRAPLDGEILSKVKKNQSYFGSCKQS